MSVKLIASFLLVFVAVEFCVGQEELSSRDKRTIELLLNQFANVLGYQVVPKTNQGKTQDFGFNFRNFQPSSTPVTPTRSQQRLQYPKGPFSLPSFFSLSQPLRAARPVSNRGGPLQIALPIPSFTTTTEATTPQETSTTTSEATITSSTTEAPQSSTQAEEMEEIPETSTEMMASSLEQSTEEIETTSEMIEVSSEAPPSEESPEIANVETPASPFLESRAFSINNGQNSNSFVSTNHLGEPFRTSTHFGNNLSPFGFSRNFIQNQNPVSRFNYFPAQQVYSHSQPANSHSYVKMHDNPSDVITYHSQQQQSSPFYDPQYNVQYYG